MDSPVHVAPPIYPREWVNGGSVMGINRAEIGDLVLMGIAMLAVLCCIVR